MSHINIKMETIAILVAILIIVIAAAAYSRYTSLDGLAFGDEYPLKAFEPGVIMDDWDNLMFKSPTEDLNNPWLLQPARTWFTFTTSYYEEVTEPKLGSTLSHVQVREYVNKRPEIKQYMYAYGHLYHSNTKFIKKIRSDDPPHPLLGPLYIRK
jgi:hypothetical protein